MWVRGLKRRWGVSRTPRPASHPVWVRGLKPIIINGCSCLKIVAPRVGAWIETDRDFHWWKGCTVAPRVGAWIETLHNWITVSFLFVAPRVGAWIETGPVAQLVRAIGVAPRVGAWIETHLLVGTENCVKSHPVWVRGLKLYPLPRIPRRGRRTPCGCVD